MPATLNTTTLAVGSPAVLPISVNDNVFDFTVNTLGIAGVQVQLQQFDGLQWSNLAAVRLSDLSPQSGTMVVPDNNVTRYESYPRSAQQVRIVPVAVGQGSPSVQGSSSANVSGQSTVPVVVMGGTLTPAGTAATDGQVRALSPQAVEGVVNRWTGLVDASRGSGRDQGAGLVTFPDEDLMAQLAAGEGYQRFQTAPGYQPARGDMNVNQRYLLTQIQNLAQQPLPANFLMVPDRGFIPQMGAQGEPIDNFSNNAFFDAQNVAGLWG